MPNRYDHIIAAVMATPWAIMPAKADQIASLLTLRASGEYVADDQVAAVVAAAQRPPTTAPRGSAIAVLPMLGTISQRMGMLSEISGGTSTEKFGATFDALVRDPGVGAIVFDVDSPGGNVNGIPELAAKIRGARGTKPIVAVANSLAASAAYWLATAADELVVSPSAQVGSIGVLMLHDDRSGALEQAGHDVTIISAGKFKAEGNPFGPLTAEAADEFQGLVDDVYGAFVSDVATQRGVSIATVEADFGQGRVFNANDAVRAGMADRVETMDQTLVRLSTAEGREAVVPRAGGFITSIDGGATWHARSTDDRLADLESRMDIWEELAPRLIPRLSAWENRVDEHDVGAELARLMKETN